MILGAEESWCWDVTPQGPADWASREGEVAGRSRPLPWPATGPRHVGSVFAGVASISEELLNRAKGFTKVSLRLQMHFLLYPWHVFKLFPAV